MRLQKSNDMVPVHIALWFAALFVGIWAWIQNNLLLFLLVSLPCLMWSCLMLLWTHGKAIIVGEHEIESRYFYVFKKTIKWESVIAYTEILKRGSYVVSSNKFGSNSGHTGDTFILQLQLRSKRPYCIKNNLTNYKTFKKILKQRQIERITPANKKNEQKHSPNTEKR